MFFGSTRVTTCANYDSPALCNGHSCRHALMQDSNFTMTASEASSEIGFKADLVLTLLHREDCTVHRNVSPETLYDLALENSDGEYKVAANGALVAYSGALFNSSD
jgi:hypothetical protein